MTLGDGDADTLVQDNRTYASVHLENDATLDTIAEAVHERLERDPTIAGVVLRCPATHTRQAQRLADDLCTEAVPIDREGRTLEKVGSAVVDEHEDDLEYRLYLHEKD
jgi:ribosome-interacting GTPase 1